MTRAIQIESNRMVSPALLSVLLLVVTIAAAMTVAGPVTPCAEFTPNPIYWGPYRFDSTSESYVHCIGQLLVISTIPAFFGVLAASSSRWKSGVHLLAAGMAGAAASIGMALFSTWPRTGIRAPLPLLRVPFLTSVVVIAMLALEQFCGFRAGGRTDSCPRL